MPVPKEKHDSAWVVELVHGVEVGDFLDVYDVEDGEILNGFGAFDKHFVHLHAG